MSYFGGCSRYLCSVLNEMRKQLKAVDTVNLHRYKSIMAMMIEEAQTHGNNMEAGLEDWDSLRCARKELSKLKKEIKALREEKKDIVGDTKHHVIKFDDDDDD